MGACLAPESLAASSMLGCLPNVSVQEANGNSSETIHAPTIIRADDLFIRCNNAVFSGTQIHARLVDAIVTGDLTIETLTNEFCSESESTGFSACLGAIANLTKDVKPDASIFQNPRLGAVPHIRIANGEHLSRKIGELASIIGTERFYLTVGGLLYKKSAQVGLKPDGVVVHNDAERIQASRILEEQVQEIESHERHVFNPAISEFIGMMAQVDELQQTNAILAQIEHQQMLENVEKEARKETARAAKRAIAEEEQKISRVAEETADINDRLTQRVKDRVGETEISKLTSGEAISESTKAVVAEEVNVAIDALQAKTKKIHEGGMSTNEIERKISAASRETQLEIINERINQYQQLLFALDHATPSTQPITRVREGIGAVIGTFAETCHLADTMDYEQYVAYQMAQMPEELRSNPEYCRTVAAGYFAHKGFAQVGKAIRAVDDATGNVASWLLNKVGDLSRAVFGAAERGLKSLEIPNILVENSVDIAEIFAPGAAVKLSKAAMITAGLTKFRGAALGTVTKSTAAVVDGSEIGMSWGENWFKRGYDFERFQGRILATREITELPKNFKTFDFYGRENGIAVSVKTLDTMTPSRIARPELIRYQINGYINKMIDFTDYTLERFYLDSSMITAKELHLAIPASTSTTHMQQIQHCIDFGALNGVKVVITKVK